MDWNETRPNGSSKNTAIPSNVTAHFNDLIMKLTNLEKLYIHELKDLYSAEKQIYEALPEMEKAATDADLKKAFKDHRTETKSHLTRLEKIFEALPAKPGGEKCEGAQGLIKEGKSFIQADGNNAVRDAALISAAQRVEHYEIAGYGTLVAMAQKLGKHDQADLLRETLEEEGLTDRKLTHLAEKSINFQALAH